MSREILRALRPVARRMRLRRAALGFSWGALAGAVCAAAWVAASFLAPVESAALWAGVSAAAVCALCCATALLFPVRAYSAARAADGCGLQERATTAMELQQDAGPMADLVRRDALRALSETDFGRAMPARAAKKPLLCALALAVLLSLTAFLPNPQSAVLHARRRFAGEMEKLAQKAETGSETLDEALYTPEEMEQLRRALHDLARNLRASSTDRQAYEAIDQARRQSEQPRAAGKTRAGEALASALAEAGLSDVAEALEAGGDALERALSGSDAASAAQSLAEAAGAFSGAQADALSAAANALRSGDTAAAAAALQRAASGVPGDMDSVLRALSTALSTMQTANAGQLSGDSADHAQANGSGSGSDGSEQGSGSGTGQDSGGDSGDGGGQGSGSGTGQDSGGDSGDGGGQGSGSGAGQGSTNEEQGGPGGAASSSGAGEGSMGYRSGEYETIYDPTRLNAAGESSRISGDLGEGESQSVDLGYGEGVNGEDVPIGQYAGEYAQAAARAANEQNLPDSLKTYVNEYFSSLTGEDGRQP